MSSPAQLGYDFTIGCDLTPHPDQMSSPRTGRGSLFGAVPACPLPHGAEISTNGKPDRAVFPSFQAAIASGARAMNRLLVSLWFWVLLVVWPSSDWIGLIVLSQALLAAAHLLKTSSEQAQPSRTERRASTSD